MKELSPERRALLAAVLSLLVIVGWNFLFKSQLQPAKPGQPAAPAQTGTQNPAAPAAPSAVSPAPATHEPAPAVAFSGLVKVASAEKNIVVENGLYRVEFSNRGAVVRSWQLKKYKDDAKPPHTLDLVNPAVARQMGGWPFSLVLDDPLLEAAANGALFEATPAGPAVHAPAQVEFEWSDGHLAVWKRLRFDSSSYIVEVETNVTLEGKPLSHGLAWRGGFGDTTVYQPAEQVLVFSSAAGKLQTIAHKNLKVPGQPSERRAPGAVDYAGIEDRYFAAAFLPKAGASEGLAAWQWKLERDVVEDGKPAKQPIAEVAVGGRAPGPQDMRIFVGPKDFDDLKRLTPPLTDLIQFGWLEWIAAPLFYLLKWMHNFIPNYGWAIIVMTLMLNMLLYPLKSKSWRQMQKMQKLQPEIKALQERYKKYPMRDPRRQKMNEEQMAIFKREGVNPMGGCLPMLMQMPIWFALYRMLTVTIELRHAPWIWWVRDLSNYDPYYILPVLMTLTMYLMQKMTPTTTTDPAQQKMMTLMPLFMGALFFRLSSGLLLYIFTSNLVGIAQQWYLNRTAPADVQAARGKDGNKKSP